MTLEQTLKQWLHNYSGLFISKDIPNGIHLREVVTAKDRVIHFAEVSQWRRKENPTGEVDYINIVFEDGRELVLCHAGFAFAPSYVSTGDAVQLPAVVCMQDYYRFKAHLDHLYQDETKKMESLQTMMSCLATLEGAKLIGLDISKEEKDLEPILSWLDTH